LCLAAVAFALGQAIELQGDMDVLRQHCDPIRRRRPPRLSAITGDRSSGGEDGAAMENPDAYPSLGAT
jgi:hypothetical protein